MTTSDYGKSIDMFNGPPFLTKHWRCVSETAQNQCVLICRCSKPEIPNAGNGDIGAHLRNPQRRMAFFFAGNATWKIIGRNYIIQRKTIHSTKLSSDWNWHHVLFHHSIHINSTMHRKKYAFPTSPDNRTSRRKATISAFPGNDDGHDSSWLLGCKYETWK